MNSANDSEPQVDRANGELAIKRFFHAPRELVFDTWLDAEHISHWWGPRGFTTSTSKMDARPGGEWLFVMHGPDGDDYENRVEYLDILRPERIRYRHTGKVDNEPLEFFVAVNFATAGNGTEIRMSMKFGSAKMLDFVSQRGAVEGLRDTMARLGEFLASQSARR